MTRLGHTLMINKTAHIPLGTQGPHLGEPGEPLSPSGPQPGSPDANDPDPPTCNIAIVSLGGWPIKPLETHAYTGR